METAWKAPPGQIFIKATHSFILPWIKMRVPMDVSRELLVGFEQTRVHFEAERVAYHLVQRRRGRRISLGRHTKRILRIWGARSDF